MSAYGELLFVLPFILICTTWIFLGLAKGGSKTLSRFPPGPFGLPVIGNLHQIGASPETQNRKLHELSKRHGPLMQLRLGSVPAVVVSSAQMAEEVLRKNDLKVSGRPPMTPWRHISYDFSDIGFSPYSETWREFRKLMMVCLLGTKKLEESRHIREEDVGRIVASVSSSLDSDPSKPIDMNALLHSFSNTLICRLAFGTRFDHGVAIRYCSENSKSYGIFREAEAVAQALFLSFYIPWAGWVDRLTGLQARLRRICAETDAFCREVVEAHTKIVQVGECKDDEKKEEDLVDTLLRLRKEDNCNLTMDSIKGLISDIIIAGASTVALTTEFAMAELIMNPGAMQRAQAEVRGVVAAKGKVEQRDFLQLKYVKSVVKETLRLHPPAPLLVPRETTDDINICGYYIPAKTMVLVNAWAIGRDPTAWKDPHKFLPERFLDSTVDYKGQDFQFIPFGSGRRICPGMNLGFMTVELAVASLLYSFDWELPKGIMGNDMDVGDDPVVRLKNKLHLAATKYQHLI